MGVGRKRVVRRWEVADFGERGWWSGAKQRSGGVNGNGERRGMRRGGKWMEAKEASGEELKAGGWCGGSQGYNKNWEAFGEQGPCGCAESICHGGGEEIW